MKLQALVDAVRKELVETGCKAEWVHLSAAFTAKEMPDGTVQCRFVHESAIPSPREAEIHRVEIPIKVSNTVEVFDVVPETPPEKRAPKQMTPHEVSSTSEGISISKLVPLSRSDLIGDPLLSQDPLDEPIHFRDLDEEKAEDESKDL